MYTEYVQDIKGNKEKLQCVNMINIFIKKLTPNAKFLRRTQAAYTPSLLSTCHQGDQDSV